MKDSMDVWQDILPGVPDPQCHRSPVWEGGTQSSVALPKTSPPLPEASPTLPETGCAAPGGGRRRQTPGARRFTGALWGTPFGDPIPLRWRRTAAAGALDRLPAACQRPACRCRPAAGAIWTLVKGPSIFDRLPTPQGSSQRGRGRRRRPCRFSSLITERMEDPKAAAST